MSLRPGLCLRNHLHLSTSPLRAQRRWARVHDIRFAARHNTTSSGVQQKYNDKLEQKARDEGFESVDHLKAAYSERIHKLRKRVSEELAKAGSPQAEQTEQAQSQSSSQQQTSPFQQPPPLAPQPQSQSGSASPPSQQQTPSKNASQSSSSNTPGIKPLSSYLDLDKISTLPVKEIEYLWRLRHASSPLSLCATVPLPVYTRILANARTHPRFILPLPRPASSTDPSELAQSPDGFDAAVPRTASDIHFLQWSFHPPAGAPPPPGSQTANTHTSTILFTHLAAFKLHGEFAQPHTTVTHHLDLADSHGIVLLNGSVTEGKGVSVEEGKWLLLCMQKFYDFEGHGGGVGREKRQGLLSKFSRGDESFSLDELVDEAERIS